MLQLDSNRYWALVPVECGTCAAGPYITYEDAQNAHPGVEVVEVRPERKPVIRRD